MQRVKFLSWRGGMDNEKKDRKSIELGYACTFNFDRSSHRSGIVRRIGGVERCGPRAA